LVSSPFGLVRANFGFFRVKHRLAHLLLDDLVEVGVSLAGATEIYRRYYQAGQLGGADPLPSDAAMPTVTELSTDTILSVLMCGMFAAAARASVTAELLEKWRSSAAGMGLSPKLVAWIDLAQSLFIAGSVDGQTAMRDASLGWEGQVLATLRVATDDATRPAELLTAHVCWVNTLRNIGKSFLPADDIEHLVTVSWQRLSECTFLLRMPSTTVLDLKRACASLEHGWRKIGEVLAAAQYVVPGTVPQTMRDAIRSQSDHRG
jgi:hypothetical protein